MTKLLRLLYVLCASALAIHANADVLGGSPFTVLLDTRSDHATPLKSEDFARADAWTVVAPGTTDYEFKGDAIVANDRIVAVLRKQGNGVEVYALRADGPVWRTTLQPMSKDSVEALHSLTVEKNEDDGVALSATYSPDDTYGLRLELGLGQVHVKTQALGDTKSIRVVAPCRFAVMPDFFADDIVLDACAIPVERVEEPSENIFMHMVGEGDAVVMAVWENRDQDITVELSGTGDARTMVSSEIALGVDEAVWVAVLDQPGIWHSREIAESDLGEELPLEWRAPYDAIWRVDWHRADGLNDSWEMILEKPDGSFTKPDLFEEIPENWAGQNWWSDRSPRSRWNTVLGRYYYPAWFDKEGKAYLQPIKEIFNWSTSDEGDFHPLPENMLWIGPALIYPVDRRPGTPLDRYSVTDVVRNTLGVGPCQYILDVEGQKSRFNGRPTCGTRDILNEIYEKGEQLNRRDAVNQAVDDVITFITLIRTRIEAYREFGNEMDAYLAQQEKEHPELHDFVELMKQANAGIASAIANREDGIQSIPYAKDLADKFRADVAGHDDPDALSRCEAITLAWVHMGDNQDELVAECRVAVKVLRQRAVMAAQTDPRTADLVQEIRERTQTILRSPVSYEGARH